MVRAGNMAAAERALHVLNRVAFGPRPGDFERVRALGAEGFVAEQLDPESIPVPAQIGARLDALGTIRMTPPELFMRFRAPLMGLAKGDEEARKRVRRRARTVLI